MSFNCSYFPEQNDKLVEKKKKKKTTNMQS